MRFLIRCPERICRSILRLVRRAQSPFSYGGSRSLSDLGAVWLHNVVWLGGWCTRCSGGNEQFSRGGSGDGVSAAALGERVASRAASGAVCGGGGRKFRPESDDGRLSWFGFGVVPSGGVAGHPGLWLRERGFFEPQAGAGDV